MKDKREISIVNVEQARVLCADPSAVVLEALPKKYYRKGHLPSAQLAPLDLLRAEASNLIPAPTTPVMVYCSGPTCSNSHQAADILAELGYQDIRVFVAGKQGWVDAGYELVGNSRNERTTP